MITGLILLGSCSSQPPAATNSEDITATTIPKTTTTAPIPTTTKKRFENQIAVFILSEVQESLPGLQGIARVQYLQQKSEQFNRGVNNNLLSSKMLLEKNILDYLLISEDILLNSDSYASTLVALSSLGWKPETYEQKILEELSRIDQTIAMLASNTSNDEFNHHDHMSRVRKTSLYPEDTFNGRQNYLDRLSQEMVSAQANWYDTYNTYSPSELSILGEEGSTRSFHYSADGLVINLDQVKDLPAFELKCLAAFYGFPGLQSFVPRPEDSLRSFLNLPAYTLGWAGYILDEIGTRDLGNSLDYLYFARLQSSMALTDLKLHRNKWTSDEAVKYITENTPYASHRIRLLIRQIQQNPGYYAAAIGGKLKFSELKGRCEAEGKSCQADFNQQVINQGPIPFEILESMIF
ncbi:MAG: DUF885 family protein [Gammaproteobacteria bacterium]|nr:DUF885 family protein [Gammaproteobacteria bacterium]